MKYKAILCSLVLIFASFNVARAATIADPNDPIYNDITYILPDEHDNTYGYFVNRFNAYAVGTGNTYIYNDGAGSSSSAGAIKIRGMTNRVVQIEITNMQDAGTNTIGFFMANGTTTPTLWALIYEAVYNGTVTSSGTTTGSIVLSEPHDYDRIGIKRSGTSTADVTVKETYTRVWK